MEEIGRVGRVSQAVAQDRQPMLRGAIRAGLEVCLEAELEAPTGSPRSSRPGSVPARVTRPLVLHANEAQVRRSVIDHSLESDAPNLWTCQPAQSFPSEKGSIALTSNKHVRDWPRDLFRG